MIPLWNVIHRTNIPPTSKKDILVKQDGGGNCVYAIILEDIENKLLEIELSEEVSSKEYFIYFLKFFLTYSSRFTKQNEIIETPEWNKIDIASFFFFNDFHSFKTTRQSRQSKG